MAKFLDDNGLLYFWNKLKSYFVKQETGKGLSTNDLTNELKTNYDAAKTHVDSTHAPANAEQNVQSNWNEADAGSDAHILNKPSIPTVTNDLTNELKGYYDAAYNHSQTGHAPANAEANVQPDWSEGDMGSDAYIKNKPALIPVSQMAQPNGVATLDDEGLVPSTQLPSYVDDVVELIEMTASSPASCVTEDLYFNTTDSKIYTATGVNTWGTVGVTPEKSKIYVDLLNSSTYRWGGTEMVPTGSTDLSAITNSEIDAIAT